MAEESTTYTLPAADAPDALEDSDLQRVCQPRAPPTAVHTTAATTPDSTATDSWSLAGEEGSVPWGEDVLLQTRGDRTHHRRSAVRFVNSTTGVALSVPVQGFRAETTFLTQIRRQVRYESSFKNCVGRLVEILTEIERKPTGVQYHCEPHLTDNSSRVLRGVRGLFQEIGGEFRGGRDFDVVFFINSEPLGVAHVAATRRLLETELYFTRFPIEESMLPWSGHHLAPMFHSYLQYYHGEGLISRAVMLLRRELRSRSNSELDLLKSAQRVWEISLATYAYATTAGDRTVPVDTALGILVEATQVLCEACLTMPGDLNIASDAFDEMLYFNKSDILTEPSGPAFWRLLEYSTRGSTREAQDPCQVLKKVPSSDPTVLLNTDSCCWLNTVLVSLFSVEVVRDMILASTAESALLTALKDLFAYMTPGQTLSRFVYTTAVKGEMLSAVSRSAQYNAEGSLSDACELLTIIPSILDAEMGAGSNVFEALFRVDVQTFSLRPEDESSEPKTSSEYPLFVNVTSETPPAVCNLFRLHDGSCLYDTLPMLLLQSLETTGHSLQVVTSAPPVLCINVRRKQWDKVKGRPYHSEKSVDIPTTLDLTFLMGGSERIRARRELAVAEAELAEVAVFDPKERFAVEATQQALNNLPSTLRNTSSNIDELNTAVTALRSQIEAISTVRTQIIDTTCAKIHSALTNLQNAEQKERPGYTLQACVLYTEYYRGHYWAYVKGKEEGVWLRCDDRPEVGEDIPAYMECTEGQMLEEAKTAVTCLLYCKDGEAGCGGGLGQEVQNRIAKGNSCIEQLLALCGLPNFPSTAYGSEEYTSSAPRMDSSEGHFEYGAYNGAQGMERGDTERTEDAIQASDEWP